jgi:hypothetical protein
MFQLITLTSWIGEDEVEEDFGEGYFAQYQKGTHPPLIIHQIPQYPTSIL